MANRRGHRAGAWCLVWVAVCWCALATAGAPVRPNVLLILLDDAGYSDVGGFGRDDAPTPHLRAIADQGVRFTRHYADSTCRPARLALLTGRESARVAQNSDFRGIPPELTTLPEALTAQGYHTVHIGKWHLGDSVRASWPDQQGFDHWFGFLNQFQLKGPAADGRFTKRPTYLNPFLQEDGQPLQQHQGHLEDLLTAKVLAVINGAAGQAQPWFINWWLFAPHHPSTASAAWLKRFPDTPAGKYQALLAQADDNVGQVVAALRKTGQLDHTLIVVASDNGGTNQMMNNNVPYAGVKAGFEEGSLRTPLLIRWPDQRHAGEQQGAVVAIQDIYPTVMESLDLPIPSGLDGQSLLPLLAGKPLAPRWLVHEIAVPGQFNFSELDPTGRWRLTRDALYDLQQQPQGDVNVAAEQSVQQQVLIKQFWTWRNHKLTVPLTTTRTGNGWTVTGNDFLRAPGYGAYSFVVGLSSPAASATVAQQAGVWSMVLQPDRRLRLQIGELDVQSSPLPAVPSGQCLPVVFTSYFSRSRLHEGKNAGQLRVYAAGQLVLDQSFDNPPEPAGDLSAPTVVGVGARSPVGSPAVFNADLADSGTEWPEITVTQAGAAACQRLAATVQEASQ